MTITPSFFLLKVNTEVLPCEPAEVTFLSFIRNAEALREREREREGGERERERERDVKVLCNEIRVSSTVKTQNCCNH